MPQCLAGDKDFKRGYRLWFLLFFLFLTKETPKDTTTKKTILRNEGSFFVGQRSVPCCLRLYMGILLFRFVLLYRLILSSALLNWLQNGFGASRNPISLRMKNPQKPLPLGVRDKIVMNWLMN